MMLALTLFLHLLLVEQTTAIPTLAYPFNSQIPPVARVGQSYSYVLASNTFGDLQSDVTYSLSGQPAWLSLDSSTRTLSGTPQSSDAGDADFDIIATDSTGSTSDSSVLVVSTNSAPYVADNIEAQLAGMGEVDATGALILKQNEPFVLEFSAETFAETGGNFSAYYGTSDNFTPLPSWISFDAASIEFTGTAPPVVSAIAPPQYFEFVLVGTDYPGFAGISATFSLVIGAHELYFSSDSVSVEASVGTDFSYQVPISDLLLDGVAITSADISSVSANTTGSWLVFDSSTYVLSGTPSSSASAETDIQVAFTDIYSDTAALRVNIVLDGSYTRANANATSMSSTNATVFTGSLPTTFEATPGTFFSYTFNSSVIPSTATINVTISGASWLHYNSANKTLYGEVPQSATEKRSIGKRQSGNTGSVTVTATDGSTTQTETIGVNLGTASPTATTTTTTSPTSTTSIGTKTTSKPTSSATHSTVAAARTSHGLSKDQKLGLALGIGLPILIALLALLAFCCLRKRKARSLRSVSSSDISRPVEGREKDEWPQSAAVTAYDEPRQLGAFEMFKSNSSGRLSGYAMEVNTSGFLEPPLAPLAHELPPLPESPGFEAVRSAYGSDGSNTGTSSTLDSDASFKRPGRALSENTSIGNIQSQRQVPNQTIKQVYNPRQSALMQENHRDSTNTLDSVSTDELFSVRLIGTDSAQANAATAPPLARPMPAAITRIGTQHSAQTIGTYTSSEGDYIQRYGSQGESLSSEDCSRQHLSQISRNDSGQPQPWRVMNSQDSYGSFGSYATTDSGMSDEFSLDESHSGSSNGSRRLHGDAIAEESESEDSNDMRPADLRVATIANRPGSEGVLLEAPLTPNWASTPLQAVTRRPTLKERVASLGKGRLMESTARRPMSSASIGSPDVSADTETSAEIAFV